MSRKHKAKQVDINWGEPEAFALKVETGLDGDRIAREKAKSAADRIAAENQQERLLDWEDTAKQYQAV